MGHTAVFIGAGASKPLGLPLTNDIFPQSLERLAAKSLYRGDAVDLERLRRCFLAFLPGIFAPGAPRDVLPPITDLLSLVDYFLLSGNAPDIGVSRSELARARTLIDRAVFELLVLRGDGDGDFEMIGEDDQAREWVGTLVRDSLRPRPAEQDAVREQMADWLSTFTAPGDRLTVISTNYDIEVEQVLFQRRGYEIFDGEDSVDFGTGVRNPKDRTDLVYPRPRDASLGIYKLHGSLNWLRCDLCDTIYVNPRGAIALLSFLFGEDAERYKQKHRNLAMLEERYKVNECHCGYRPLRHMIVAPSLVRDVRDPILLEIWRNALGVLRQADRWFLIGYSLPPEDLAIRSMLLRALKSRKAAPEITVVQRSIDNRPRYDLLFAGTNYEYFDGGLEDFLASRRGPG